MIFSTSNIFMSFIYLYRFFGGEIITRMLQKSQKPMNQHDTLAVTGSSKHQQTKIASEAHFNRSWIKHSRNRKNKRTETTQKLTKKRKTLQKCFWGH